MAEMYKKAERKLGEEKFSLGNGTDCLDYLFAIPR